MPSPVGHLIAGATAGLLVNGPTRLPMLVAFGLTAVLPDLDLLTSVHRGPTHGVGSAAIAGIVGWAVWPLVDVERRSPRERLRFAVAIAAAYATHILLDWLSADTSAPVGLMALWPFSRRYYEPPLHLFLSVNRRYWLLNAWMANIRAVALELLILVPLFWAAARVRRRPPWAGAADIR